MQYLSHKPQLLPPHQPTTTQMKERKETEKVVYYTNESNDSGQLFDLLMKDTDQDDVDGGKGSGGAELVGPPVEQNTFNVEDEIIMHDGEDVEEQSEVHDVDVDDHEEEEIGSGLEEDYSTPTSTSNNVVDDSATSYHCNDTPTTDDASNNINDNGSVTTNKVKITKQLIQFDYDILLSKTSSSVLLQKSKQKEEEKKKRYSNEDRDDSIIEEEDDDDDIDPEVIIAEFEQQLLNDVGLSLNDAGICNNSSESKEDDSQEEGVRRVMVLRRKVGHRRATAIGTDNANSQGVDLVELSSLPLDEIDDSGE